MPEMYGRAAYHNGFRRLYRACVYGIRRHGTVALTVVVTLKEGRGNMPIMESVAVAGFFMIIVFAVLFCICMLIKCFSLAVVKLERKFGKNGN